MSRLLDYTPEYRPSKEDTIESTLAWILMDLNDIDRSNRRFTAWQDDQLLAIEQKCREMRNKL